MAKLKELLKKLLANAKIHAALVDLAGVTKAAVSTFWHGMLTYVAGSALGFTSAATWQAAVAAGVAAVIAALGSGTIDVYQGRQYLKQLNQVNQQQ